MNQPSPILGDRFERALVYAHRLHHAQTRKGSSIPYISHLLGVVSIAIEHGASEDEAIAALLHDAVEDCGGDPVLVEIREKFGDAVAEIVHACSDSFTTPKPPWRDRKERYLAHLREASPSVQLVSGSDKLHNSRSILMDYRAIGDDLWNRFRGGKDGTLWYYRPVVDILLETCPHRSLVLELEATVESLEMLA